VIIASPLKYRDPANSNGQQDEASGYPDRRAFVASPQFGLIAIESPAIAFLPFGCLGLPGLAAPLAAFPANLRALERQSCEVCLACHLRATEPLFDRQYAVRVDLALELRAKRLPGCPGEFARVVARMHDVGAEPAGEYSFRMTACHA